MILMDSDYTIYTDTGEEVSEAIRTSLVKSRAYMAKLGNVLYRFDEFGDLFLYFVDTAPFKKLEIPQWKQMDFRKRRDVFCDGCHIMQTSESTATAYIGNQAHDIPMELMFRW